MTPEAPKHKLAAIMFTDMVGYTSLMQKDEPRARELIESQREILTPLVKKHDGEVLQYVGDGTFCTFNSAIEAVNCAIEIQLALLTEVAIRLRIGIHVGDVVVKGDEVYGDGVNVASRLEPLAEPGGILIDDETLNNVVINLLVDEWLKGIGITTCLDDGDLILDNDGNLLIDDSSGGGGCQDIEGIIKLNIKNNFDLSD